MTPSRRLVLVSLLAGLAAPIARAADAPTEISGVRFEPKAQLGGQALVLNGVGLRARSILKGYAAGLYIAQKASTPEAVVAVKGPKRIRMRMMVEVESKEFVKAFDKGMKRNLSEAEFAALTDRMAKFDAMVNALVKLKKGDVVDLDYLPSRGLVLSLNGVAKGEALPGEDLYAGLLKIFIGTRPVDTKLKAGLLGQT